MKKHVKTLLVVSVSAAFLIGSVSAFAAANSAANNTPAPSSDPAPSSTAQATEPALALTEKTDRFTVKPLPSDAPESVDSTGKAVAPTAAGFSMISSDGQLVIHVAETTEIVFEDGKAVRESLEGQTLDQLLDGRKLTVSYGITTRSMPPQTTPSKIVVLYETATTLPAVTTDSNDTSNQIFVLGEQLVSPAGTDNAFAPYVKNDVVMLPLRAVSEKLGFTVRWEPSTKSIMLGNSIAVSVGKDYYTVGRMTPITLGTAPEIVNGLTYVPMDFFQKVVTGYHIEATDNKITIEKSAADLAK